jgi:DNA topoisomerase-2
MCLFTDSFQLKKFNTPDEIIDSYCRVRYAYYIKRKVRQLADLEHKIKFLGNKKRFLQEVRDGKIKLFEIVNNKRQSRKTADLIDELEERGYDKDAEEPEEEEEEEEEKKTTVDHGYDYLLRLQFRSITEEKINKLKKDIASFIEDRDELANTTEKEMWINDLEEFEVAYKKWLRVIAKEKVKKRKPRK